MSVPVKFSIDEDAIVFSEPPSLPLCTADAGIDREQQDRHIRVVRSLERLAQAGQIGESRGSDPQPVQVGLSVALDIVDCLSSGLLYPHEVLAVRISLDGHCDVSGRDLLHCLAYDIDGLQELIDPALASCIAVSHGTYDRRCSENG